MQRRSSSALAAPSPAAWPADDTEESVLGTDLHQSAITHLRTAINEAAALATAPGAPLVWHAGGQTMVSGFQHPDGSGYTTFPDVFVYPHAWDPQRGSLNVALDGPPLLVIEVLSKETFENDLDQRNGKGYSYRAAGVGEYLTLDPSGAYHPEQGQGWQWAGGRYRAWRRERDGRWHSRRLPLSFGLEGVLMAVFDTDGRRLLREGEVERTVRELERRERRQAEELARLEHRWAEERALRQADLAKERAQHEADLAEERARREADLAELERLRHRLAERENDQER